MVSTTPRPCPTAVGHSLDAIMLLGFHNTSSSFPRPLGKPPASNPHAPRSQSLVLTAIVSISRYSITECSSVSSMRRPNSHFRLLFNFSPHGYASRNFQVQFQFPGFHILVPCSLSLFWRAQLGGPRSSQRRVSSRLFI